MEDVLLSVATLSVPCVLYGVIAPGFVLDTAGWSMVGVCCAWALYVFAVFLICERLDWNVEEFETVINFAAVHVGLFAIYIVDYAVNLDLSMQLMVGILAWLLGALVAGQQWRLLAPKRKTLSEIVAVTTLAVFVSTYLLGCLATFDALVVGIVFVALLQLVFQYASYGLFDARLQLYGGFWVALFVFQQIVHYCPRNSMLWVPLVVMAVLALFRWTQGVVSRIVAACGYGGRDPDSVAQRQMLRTTVLYTALLVANAVTFSIYISSTSINLVADIVFLLLFIALVVFQFVFSLYARDALLIGGTFFMVSLTPLVQIHDAPGWIAVLIYVFGALVATLVWSRPMLPNTIRRPLYYRVFFSFATVILGLIIWGALFVSKRAPTTVVDYIQCAVGVLAYFFLLLLGTLRSYASLGWVAVLTFLFYIVSAALQIGFALERASVQLLVLIVYGIVIVSFVAALYAYREYELHTTNLEETKTYSDGKDGVGGDGQYGSRED